MKWKLKAGKLKANGLAFVGHLKTAPSQWKLKTNKFIEGNFNLSNNIKDISTKLSDKAIEFKAKVLDYVERLKTTQVQWKLKANEFTVTNFTYADSLKTVSTKLNNKAVEFKAKVLDFVERLRGAPMQFNMKFGEFVAIGMVVSLGLGGVATQAANPFNPILSGATGGATDAYIEGSEGQLKHPLQQYAVTKYSLIATLSSAKGEIALIRANNGEEYFVRVNDLLGDADGKISKIHGNGLEVSEKDQIIVLSVRNRSSKK